MLAGKHYIIRGEEIIKTFMNKYIRLITLFAICATIAACSSSGTKEEQQPYRKKIYLTEQDYLDDLGKEAYAERREAKPNAESNYVFNVLPETPKNVYFFDERVQPKIPGVPSDRDYKNTKRLWEKPRRYSPEKYYGEGAVPGAEASSGNTTDQNNSYDYE